MLIPKASHLVERVAERLLRSGSLDESTTQLLQPQGGNLGADTVTEATDTTNRSSLFAAPAAAPPGSAPSAELGAEAARPYDAHGPAMPLTNATATALAGEFETAIGQSPAATIAPLPRPAIQPSGGAGASFVPPPPMARQPLADAPASLQAAGSVDAVSLERAGMVDWSRTRSRISEEFRLVQRQILRAAFGPGAEPGFSNLLMVTSARPGEGKSFMSVNMSGSIARQGDNHVLLVDADSKRDSICYSLGLAQARGLLDLASNPKLDPAPLIVRTPIERLTVLPVGRERERSAELFSTKEMTRLIQSLGRRYADRLLILDAPPCLSTSDPALLAQVVGQILFVVEADRTQRDEVEASLDLIQACPTITMVLNKQQISSRYTFGAYSSYYSS